ncbi:T-box transcription factor tbx19 [Plakobranchus ocellatus]|uniref:T-box transcription factor tbx19 n=1 Tax=Plakobranchus ocellatus TaxID=259542 RepID=A0AAV4CCW3_9GAST|nr:T-box transcription factor tbx19 [Plakobranchus ocellatus]
MHYLPNEGDDTHTSESSSDDCNDQLATFSQQSSYSAANWTVASFPNVGLSCPISDSALRPGVPSAIEQSIQSQALHAAPPFSVFPHPRNAYHGVYASPFMLTTQATGMHPAHFRPPREPYLDQESLSNMSMPLEKKSTFDEKAEESTPTVVSSFPKRSRRMQSMALKVTEPSSSHSLPAFSSQGFSDARAQDVSGQPSTSHSCYRPEITLRRRDVWAATQEVVVSEEGRPMYPHLDATATHLEPDRLYSCFMELMPTSPRFYEYVQGEWLPSVDDGKEPGVESYRPSCSYEHPDNPRQGRYWDAHGISFEGLHLATACQGKNKIKVQLRRQYYPVLTISSQGHSWRYPLRIAMFITVSIDRDEREIGMLARCRKKTQSAKKTSTIQGERDADSQRSRSPLSLTGDSILERHSSSGVDKTGFSLLGMHPITETSSGMDVGAEKDPSSSDDSDETTIV